MGITVDKEFEALIPPLAAEEFAQLEENCVRDGIRDPLIVWPQEDGSDILIDGHNRFKISAKHCGLPFGIKRMTFESREDAKIWIIQNQIGRRNLNTYNRSVLALELKPLIAKRAKKKLSTHTEQGYQKSDKAVDTTKELAAIAGVSHDTIHKVEAIEKAAGPELKKQVRAGDVSVNQAYQRVRQEQKRARRQAEIQEQISKPKTNSHVDIFTTTKKYRVIYADPPWSYGDKQNIDGLGGAEKHYTTMSLDDICSLPVPAEKDAVLFLWVTSPLLEDSFKVINSWGFKYKTSFVWDKVAHNMGHYNSVRHEFLLVCTRGSCTPDVKKLFDSVVSIERTDHSRKPKEFRDIIDTIYPNGERIELFAREAPDGWDVWGNMA